MTRPRPGVDSLALRATVLLWACELALVRISSMPVPWPDVVKSALGLLAVGAVAAPLAARLPLPRRLRDAAVGALGHAPLGGVCLVILLPVLPALPVSASAWVLAGLVLGGLAGGLRGAAGGATLPGPVVIPASLAAAALGAWALQAAGLPPAPRLATLAVVWLGIALLGSAPRALPLAAAAAVVVARWPLAPPEVEWAAAGTPPAGPDLIVLSVDTLRADAAREMASHRWLAARGLEFPAMLAASPWTLPAMATVFTGLDPLDHGAVRAPETGAFVPIARHRATVAERLAQHGYDTAAVVPTNPFVGPRFGFDRGFAVFDSARAWGEFALPRGRWDPTSARPTVLQLLFAAGIDQLHPVGSADQLVARAEAILARRRDRPLLLWVHFFDCHLPYRHADATDLPAARMRTLERSARAEILRDPHWATSAGTEQLRRAYRNEVEHVDRAILGLLEQLETRPRDRVVLLLSDHGEELFERGSVGHGHSFHEEIVGLALALARLGGADGPARQVTTPVGHLDVAPTLLKLGGLPIASLPGQDLLGSVEARPYHSRNLYWPGEDPERRAIRAGRWKALVGRGGDRALYDLERDPGERRRLVREPVEAARALRRPAPLGRRDPRPPAAELDARDRDALRALGYLDE